jgi:hypothetical protein
MDVCDFGVHRPSAQTVAKDISDIWGIWVNTCIDEFFVPQHATQTKYLAGSPGQQNWLQIPHGTPKISSQLRDVEASRPQPSISFHT